MKILDQEQIEEFLEQGFTILREAFSPDDAAAAREVLWQRLEREGVRRDTPATGQKPLVHLKEIFSDGPFDRVWSVKVRAAIDDLVGENPYDLPYGLGWWPVAFAGFEGEVWRAPEQGWHVDGIQFHHRLTSPDQGLLPLFFFSRVQAGDGGTAISPGSHRVTAQILANAEPDGLDADELSRRVREAIPNIPATARELTGEAGDVALLHPFMLHARSIKTGGEVRFICNPCVSLREPMNLDAAARPISPVEAAIRCALI